MLLTRLSDKSGVPFIFLALYLSVGVRHTLSAGSRMIEPPTRSSYWRYGHGTPVNRFDDEILCGGYQIHYSVNKGRCGVCGDSWNESIPRPNEAGGKWAPQPLPVRVYQKGTFISVAVESTSGLLGKYEFRLCKLNASSQTPDQTCFDQLRLAIREAEMGESFQIGQSGGLFSLQVKLPDDLSCTHCILQWRHITGYRTNRLSCVQCPGQADPQCNYCQGCGDQVWYQGCSDIAIRDIVGSHPSLLGIRSQQELKTQWETTLSDLQKKCSCVTGAQDSGAANNAINLTNPSPAFNSSVNSARGQSAVRPSSIVNGKVDIKQTSFPSLNMYLADWQLALNNTPQPNKAPIPPANNYSQPDPLPTNPLKKENLLNDSGSKLLAVYGGESSKLTQSQNAYHLNSIIHSLNAVSQNLNSNAVSHSSTKDHSYPGLDLTSNMDTRPSLDLPVFNPALKGTDFAVLPQHAAGQRVTNTPIRTGQLVSCYVPHHPPYHLQNAGHYCATNCPHFGAVCFYRTCRPAHCHQQTTTVKPNRRAFDFSRLLPFLLTELR